MLDATIQNFFHIGAARIRHDAAITERTRAPFGAALEPAQNFTVHYHRSGTLVQYLIVEFLDDVPVAYQTARKNGRLHVLSRKFRAPVGMLHHEGARLLKFLMPDVVGGTDRKARVAGSGLHEDLFEGSAIENFAVGHAIEGHAARQTHGFQAGAYG